METEEEGLHSAAERYLSTDHGRHIHHVHDANAKDKYPQREDQNKTQAQMLSFAWADKIAGGGLWGAPCQSKNATIVVRSP